MNPDANRVHGAWRAVRPRRHEDRPHLWYRRDRVRLNTGVPDKMLMPNDPAHSRHALVRALLGSPDECWWGPRLFDAYSASTTAPLPLGGGIYIFARVEPTGHRAIYVGETECFATRLHIHHEKWSDAVWHGMTHVHVWAMPGATKAERLDLERDLREQHLPLMNPPPLRLPRYIQWEGSSALPPWVRV